MKSKFIHHAASMKKSPGRIFVKRAETSPYWPEDFLTLEKACVQQLGFQYASPRENLPEQNDFLPEDSVILLTNTHTPFEKVFPQYPLRLVLHLNSGFDNFSYTSVKNSPAPILLGNPIRAESVAEAIISEVFSSTRLPLERSWNHHRKIPRQLLKNQSILILGHGHIGSIIHQCLSVFTPHIHIYDPYHHNQNFHYKPQSKFDYIVCAQSLNSHNLESLTLNFFNDHLNADHGTLINMARGKLIKWADLISFLKLNSNCKAVCDVFPSEPMDFSPYHSLIDKGQLKTSSHIAGYHNQLAKDSLDFLQTTLQDFSRLSSEDFLLKYSHLHLQKRHPKDFLHD